jgi:glycosyltransferase involved in cell wall biosynthesis
MSSPRKLRLLIFVVAYNAERTIQKVIHRIPSSLAAHDTEILIIDDSSRDTTFEQAQDVQRAGQAPFPMTVLYNPVNQGYGGNQKLGFQYAIQNGFDVVALVHGDGQYAPECLPDLLHPLAEQSADAVFGSRMMTRFAALKGGMPYYKYIGNRILTGIQNRLLRSSLTEFHSGYRLYSVSALKRIPFERNTDDFHFDTEIIIQLFRAGLRIKELPIPTYYGDEICHVNGIKYALDVVRATLVARAQDLGILYERKFDVRDPARNNSVYLPKLSFESPHTLTLERIPPGSRVADIGCAAGYMSSALKAKQCRVTGIDQYPIDDESALEHFIQCDLDQSEFPLDAGSCDYILLLDVIEHLRSPHEFLDSLRRSRVGDAEVRVFMSTANIGFFVTRLALLFGWFNYGPRGILDITHTRLFTFATAKDLLQQSGYEIEEVRGVPAPYPLAFGDSLFAKIALAVNKALIRFSKSLFSYQIFIVCSPKPSLEWLLARAHATSKMKVESATQ